MGEATVDVTKKESHGTLRKELLAFRPGHIRRKIESVNNISFVTESKRVGGSVKDEEVGLGSRTREKEDTRGATLGTFKDRSRAGNNERGKESVIQQIAKFL